MLVGSGRWAAEARCHPPPTPASPHAPCNAGTTALPKTHEQEAACSCTLATWPGLTLALSGNKVRWHPVTVGLSRAGRKVWAGSLWSASGLHDVNAHMPSLLLCFLLFNSNCSHQPVSLRMCHIFQKNRFGGYLVASVK